MAVFKTDTELYGMLKKKLDILHKISTNTQIQIEFIHRRNMKGLLRMICERDQYLEEIETLNQALDSNMMGPAANNEFRILWNLIKVKQVEIIRDNTVVLAAAEAERDHILADLRRVNEQIKLCNSYDHQWINFAGRQVNQKG